MMKMPMMGRCLQGAETAPDPLSALNDTFTGASLNAKWLTYNGGGTISVSQHDGEMDLTCSAGWDGGTGGSFWYNAFQGGLEYQEVDGDFDAVADVRVTNLAGDGLPTDDGNYRIAVLAAHDPDRSTDLNYVHVGLGMTATPGAPARCEWKTTVNNVSTFGDTAAETTAQIRLLRQGQIFTAYYRANAGDAWTEVQAMDRTAAPLPSTLQLGFDVYSQAASHDLRVFVDRF